MGLELVRTCSCRPRPWWGQIRGLDALPDPLWAEPGRKRMIQPELSARCTVLCAGRTTIKKEFLVPGDRLKEVIKKEIKVKK